MARGNNIIVNASGWEARKREGYITTAEKPGTIVQIDPTVALKGGRHTFKVYQPGADGESPLGPYFVLLNDYLQGKLATDAYAAGARCYVYTPLAGDEVNLLVANLAGTGDDHAAGEKLMVDTGTGKMIATTGTPESEPAVLLEAITDPTADTLAWCMWAGNK